LTIAGVNESIYAGFWIRFGALLLDFVIIIPVIFLNLFLNGLSKNAYYFTALPILAFHFWYSIYLVKRNGGTPGKLIAGIKILRIDGTDVTWREATLRQIVTFSLTIFGSLITMVALSEADAEYYENLNWMTKQAYLMSLTPVPFTIYTWSSNVWTYGELFTLLFNKRKRALHDLIADTVIVRMQYVDKIKDVMKSATND